jgi:hypothetical protein
MAENLPVVSNKRMTPFQVNPQVSELLNKFEKNMEALDLLTTEDDEDERLKGMSDEICVTAAAITASGGAPKKRPPPLLIPIAAVRQFTEQGIDSLNLAECLVGTPLPGVAASVSVASTTSEDDSPSPVPSDRSSPAPLLLSSPEQTVPITPLLFVNPGHELTDEIVDELPPDDGAVVAEEMVIQITPDQAPVEKENSKKRKLEAAPKVERVKRKRTTMSVKKEED